MVILDTNIIIDHLRLSGTQPSQLEMLVTKLPNDDLGLSVISIQELFAGQSTKDPNKATLLLKTIRPLRVLEYSTQVAKLAGELARDLTAPITFADAAIAATALENHCVLATLNNKHFSQISKLRLVKI